MSYKKIDKPFVVKLNGGWAVLCCFGFIHPSERDLRWGAKQNPGHPNWQACLRTANAHYQFNHKPRIQVTACQGSEMLKWE